MEIKEPSISRRLLRPPTLPESCLPSSCLQGANFQQAHTDGRALFVDGLSALFEPKASSAKADVVLCEQQ